MKSSLAESFEPRLLEYVWPGRFRLGSLVVVAAPPGTGASLFCVDLAARASAGKGWPGDSQCKGDPRDVVMHIRNRSTVAGQLKVKRGERGRIQLKQRVSLETISKALDSPTKNAVVFFDDLVPVRNWGADDESSRELTKAFAKLRDFARSGNNAVVAVVKLSTDAAMQRVEVEALNSDEYIEALVRIERDGDRTVLRSLRDSRAPRFPALEYGVRMRDRDGCRALQATYEAWVDAPVKKRKRISKTLEAEEFLKSNVYPGMTSVELLKAARKAGIPKSTLHRARKSLGFDAKYSSGYRRAWSLVSPDHLELKNKPSIRTHKNYLV